VPKRNLQLSAASRHGRDVSLHSADVPLDFTAVASFIGALGLGSVVGQWMAGSGARRAARGDVLRRLGAVESARWADEEGSRPVFRDAVRELEIAALLARIPRRPVRIYLVLAQTAYWESKQDYEESGGAPESGSVDVALAQLTRASAGLVTEAIWAARLLRWPRFLGPRANRLLKRAQCLDDPRIRRHLAQASEHPVY
jgi:hypothetical protein